MDHASRVKDRTTRCINPVHPLQRVDVPGDINLPFINTRQLLTGLDGIREIQVVDLVIFASAASRVQIQPAPQTHNGRFRMVLEIIIDLPHHIQLTHSTFQGSKFICRSICFFIQL